MVTVTDVNTQFTQSVNSCALSSYAIVGNYFTGTAIPDFFMSYCKHFEQQYSSWQCAEKVYDEHFDEEWKKRKCKGYEVIIDLHNNSGEPLFASCRTKFSAQFYSDSAPHLPALEDALNKTESFLNITFEIPNRKDFHSVTVFCGTQGLVFRDTTERGIHRCTSMASFGKLRDAVLYRKI